jgi:uncharacterized protein (DUF2062 family)
MHKQSGYPSKLYLSLIGHPGTPESVGRGVAAGLFSACILPAGHMLMAFLLATLIGGAQTVSILTTWIINPLTIPIVYPAQCYIGSFLIGRPLSYALIKHLVLDVLHNPSVETIQTLSSEIILSFFAGGLLLGTGMAATGFFLTTFFLHRHRIRQARKRKNKTIRQKEQDDT